MRTYTTEELADFAQPRVVYVRTSDGSGTGWVYKVDNSGSAWILTNEHVVDDDATVTIYPASGGGPYTGEVIGTDALRDLAVVRICCNTVLRAFELASQDEVRPGAEVLAFGYPYSAGVLVSELSVSDGIVSRIGLDSRRDSYTVQTTAESNPGNSGGPLVNTFGKVVGTMWGSVDRTPRGRPIDGVAFAVAPRTIRARLSALESGAGRVPTPTPTPTPTLGPPPSCARSSDPSLDPMWLLVLVGVGNADQRTLNAEERRCVAEAVSSQISELPEVETGFKLIDFQNAGGDEVIVDYSGNWTLSFSGALGSFQGFKQFQLDAPVQFFGRVCRDGENCRNTHFQDLSGGYISLDEDVYSGTTDVAPWVRLSASVPNGYSIRIEMIAYYTAKMQATADPSPTPTPTPLPLPLAPNLASVIFNGWVTVQNSPRSLDGMQLTAKIDDWVSESIVVGQGTVDANGFEDLTVNAPSELVGKEIKFVLNGTVEATTNSYYALINDDGSFCLSCDFSFPDFRGIVIDFPSRP
ncbi:MAG: serine protease [Chloroflexi bacterium]|nr:serine protease [Chloroflexota bacterium]